MRLNLTLLRTSGAARRSALRAPSALRAAARRSFVTNMKIEPLFPYSTLVVGLLIRWRLQTTVGPSEEGVTITRLSSSDGRTDIRTDIGGLRATHRSPYLLTPSDCPGVPGCRGHACPLACRAATLAPARPMPPAAAAGRRPRRLGRAGVLLVLLSNFAKPFRWHHYLISSKLSRNLRKFRSRKMGAG